VQVATVEANFIAQEKVLVPEVMIVDLNARRCLTQFVPSVAQLAKFPLDLMAEKKFIVVSVLVR